MTTVVLDISISLDGFIAAPNRGPEAPLGVGGERLHDWMADEAGGRLLQEAASDLGAVITGRRNYDDSLPWWGADGPTGPMRFPVVVVTHRAPNDPPQDGVYRFATGGIHDALDQAKTAADGKTVCVMGGADIGRQYLAAGLVDEISLHVAPVLFGRGTRLFENANTELVGLEPAGLTQSDNATHLHFKVSR